MIRWLADPGDDRGAGGAVGVGPPEPAAVAALLGARRRPHPGRRRHRRLRLQVVGQLLQDQQVQRACSASLIRPWQIVQSNLHCCFDHVTDVV